MSEVSAKDTLPTGLVVDDDEFSQELMRRALAPLGISALLVARDGRAAVRVLKQMVRPPDFIICDVFMPDMDGIEFVGELAKLHYQGGLVLVTGVNLDMLDVARDIAVSSKLKVLGSFTKPLQTGALALALGLEPVR